MCLRQAAGQRRRSVNSAQPGRYARVKCPLNGPLFWSHARLHIDSPPVARLGAPSPDQPLVTGARRFRRRCAGGLAAHGVVERYYAPPDCPGVAVLRDRRRRCCATDRHTLRAPDAALGGCFSRRRGRRPDRRADFSVLVRTSPPGGRLGGASCRARRGYCPRTGRRYAVAGSPSATPRPGGRLFRWPARRGALACTAGVREHR